MKNITLGLTAILSTLAIVAVVGGGTTVPGTLPPTDAQAVLNNTIDDGRNRLYLETYEDLSVRVYVTNNDSEKTYGFDNASELASWLIPYLSAEVRHENGSMSFDGYITLAANDMQQQVQVQQQQAVKQLTAIIDKLIASTDGLQQQILQLVQTQQAQQAATEAASTEEGGGGE